MESKELRIGNYVYFSIMFETIQIKSIDPDSSIILMAEPIPLTEEWLLKFGFVDNEKDILLIRFSSKEKCYHFNIPSNKPYPTFTRIEYVHQLQNLYFALTGKELEYEKIN